MSTPIPPRRWDAPWTQPTGAQPQRDPGEPSFAVLAALHLGVYLGLGALSSAAVATDDDGTNGALCALLAVSCLVAGGLCWTRTRSSSSRLGDWVADLLLASGAVLAGVAAVLLSLAGGTDSGDEAVLAGTGGVVTAGFAGAVYVVVRRTWLLLVTVAGTAVALVGLTQQADDASVVAAGGLLVVLAAFVVAGGLAGVLRPVGVAYAAAALTALTGAQVMLAGDDGPDVGLGAGYAVSAVVLGALAYAVVRARSASLLPVVLLGGFVLLPQLLSPALGGGYAFGLSVLGVGAGVAWMSVDLTRRSPLPVHQGGVFLTCTVFVLLASAVLCAAGNELVGVIAVALLGAFFGAAASARRRPATVLSGLQLVTTGPGVLAEPFGGGQAGATAVGLLLLPLVVLAALQLDRRAPRPAASPAGHEQALAGAGETLTVVGAYPLVFDALVGLLSGSGLALQLVDRAAGRLVAGDPATPVFVIAAWAADDVRTHLRVVGDPRDVTRLQQDLEGRLAAPSTSPYDRH